MFIILIKDQYEEAIGRRIICIIPADDFETVKRKKEQKEGVESLNYAMTRFVSGM